MVNNSTNINEAYTHLSSSLAEHNKDHDICRCKSRPWHGKDTTMWWGQRQYIYKQAIKNLHRFAPLKKTTYYHKNDNKMSLLTPQRTFLQQKVSIDTTKDLLCPQRTTIKQSLSTNDLLLLLRNATYVAEKQHIPMRLVHKELQ